MISPFSMMRTIFGAGNISHDAPEDKYIIVTRGGGDANALREKLIEKLPPESVMLDEARPCIVLLRVKDVCECEGLSDWMHENKTVFPTLLGGRGVSPLR